MPRTVLVISSTKMITEAKSFPSGDGRETKQTYNTNNSNIIVKCQVGVIHNVHGKQAERHLAQPEGGSLAGVRVKVK